MSKYRKARSFAPVYHYCKTLAMLCLTIERRKHLVLGIQIPIEQIGLDISNKQVLPLGSVIICLVLQIIITGGSLAIPEEHSNQ